MGHEEIERDDEDFTLDYIFEDVGPRYAADHIEELKQDAYRAGLLDAAVEAHRTWAEPARTQLKKAMGRIETGDWDEAVFHSARALEGYLTEVFVSPFAELMLRPLRDAFPHAPVRKTLLPLGMGLESSVKFICIGIAATCEKRDAERLIGDVQRILKGSKGGIWPIRNITFHSLQEPNEQDARAFLEIAREIIEAIATPLQNGAIQADRIAAEAEQKIKDSRAWRDAF